MAGVLLTLLLPALLLGARRGKTEGPSYALPRAGVQAEEATVAAPHDEVLARCAERFVAPLRRFSGAKQAAPTADAQLVSSGGLQTGAPDESTTDPRWAEAALGIQREVDGALAALSTSGHARLETLIATLPDPLDSGLGYAFDSQLQGLVLGVEADLPHAQPSSPGYHRDHSWLPWSPAPPDAKSAAVPDPGDCRHELPGVLLFRGADPRKPSLMLLLLVGESPIVGVHTKTMSRALDLARQLSPPGRSAPGASLAQQGIRVLGPSYSGSAPSLRRVLDEYPTLGVSFVSGSANGPDVARILGADLQAAEGRSTLRRHTRYAATTVPQHALECSFLHYAKQAGAEQADKEGAYAAPVDGVAILRESGTEFGGGSTPGRLQRQQVACDLRPEILLSFPFHVSAIRDAYEALDARPEPPIALDPMLARHTSLDISLPSTRRTDLEMPSSPATKYAQDLALGHVLSEIEREGVRWVGIQATDIADAIFLARKIRDVAPDVRIAFFGSDALLTHPAYRRDLLGSLMVTAYPFLGSDHFRAEPPAPDRPRIVAHPHASFANAESEGVYNAALALRGAKPDALAEYAFMRPPSAGAAAAAVQPLPVWIATLGRSGIVPMQARPAVDCHGTIFGAQHSMSRALCVAEPAADAWASFNQLRELSLHLDPDVMPPRFMHFLLALLALAFFLHHQLIHRRHLQTLDTSAYPGQLAPDDALLDRCIVRTKWRLYAAFAHVTLWLALTYLAVIYLVGAWVYFQHDQGPRLMLPLVLATLASVCLGVVVYRDVRALLHDAAQFRDFLRRRRVMDARQHPHARLLVGSGMSRAFSYVELSLGMAAPRVRDEEHDRLLFVSFAQLRSLMVLGSMVIVFFCAATALAMWSSTHAALDDGFVPSAMTLFALRHVPFTNGVSASAPILLSLVCVYLWAVGRMQRLLLLHGLSASTDRDGVLDGVSTPIRSILYPDPITGSDAEGRGDAGFTAVERGLVNAVLRPSGRMYFLALAVIGAVPAVLFVVMRPSTLETTDLTRVLYGVLGSCAMLTAATLVQLFLYRRALCCMLERIMLHPLGVAFQHVATPLRESLDAQLSRTTAPEVRWAVCEQSLQHLARLPFDSQANTSGSATQCSYLVAELHEHARRLGTLRGQALGEAAKASPSQHLRGNEVAALGRELVGAARTVTRLLEPRWRDHPPAPWSVPVPAKSERTAKVEAQDAWLAAAESFVVTVVALLLNQHVRQFRYFLSTTTACSLVLLLAVSSYPFEPHRALMTGLWMLIITVVVGCLLVFLSLDRAPLLNVIAGEPEHAGKVTWNLQLVNRVAVWVLIPILVVLATQYPDVARELSRVVEPFTFKL
jgi:hypothetical protein